MIKLPEMSFKPSYEISSKHVRLNNFLHGRILSLSIDDYLDTYIDQLSLSFDNRSFSKNLSIPAPNSGKVFQLKLGYLPLLKDMGNFYIDSWNVSSPLSILSITAKSIDLSKQFFNQQTEVWKQVNGEKKTIAQVIETIARKYQLTTEISPNFKSETVQEYQYVESDIHFLSRLAKQYNAFFKIKQNKIIFMEYDKLKRNKGINNDLNSIKLTANKLSNIQIEHQEVENYTTVHAYWYDYAKANYCLEKYPTSQSLDISPTTNKAINLNEEKIFTIRQIFSIQEEAKNAAKAKYRLLARNKQTINLKCIGNPELATGKQLTLKGMQNEINGNWIIKHINHSFDANGFVSSINAYRYT